MFHIMSDDFIPNVYLRSKYHYAVRYKKKILKKNYYFVLGVE